MNCFRMLLLSIVLVLGGTNAAHAMYTELGLSYNYMKRTFDANNSIETQGTTGSLSFYIWEQIALELSYTNSLYVQKDAIPGVSSIETRTTTQTSDTYETDLIYVLADRKAMFQPYVKGGAAYIIKKQVVQIAGSTPYDVSTSPGWGPSYGIGAKLMVTDSLAIKASYDAVHTPVDDNTYADDITARAGVSWIF